MKMKSFLCVAFSLFLLLSCSCAGCRQCTTALPEQASKSFNFVVDDSVKHLLGDSIAQIVFESDSIVLLELSVRPPKDSILNDSVVADTLVSELTKFRGCYILRNFGTLTPSEIAPLLFILSDRSAYYPNDVRVKSPFIPDVALSFIKESKQVDVVFSFTGGQIYIFTADEQQMYYKYDYERLILLYFQQYLQNDNIKQFLNLNLF